MDRCMLTRLTAVIVMVLGGVVITGWYIHNTQLIQIHPEFAPMQYNTAFCFICSAVGLLALTWRRMNITIIGGGLAGLIGLLTLVQYGFDIDLGIDRLGQLHYVMVRTSHAGRMAPNTALCFMLIGIALIVACSSVPSFKVRLLTVEILGFIVAAIAVVALYGYLLDVEFTYGWKNLTRMALHTATGFSLLSIGLIAYVWGQYKDQTAIIPLWVPIVICLGGVLLEVSLPLQGAAGIVYIPLVFCTSWFTRPSSTFVFALMGTVLILLGYYVMGAEAESVTTVVNRILSVIALWVVAVLVYRQKLGQQKLEESKAKLASVIDTTVEGIITIDDHGLIQSYNKACETLFGYGWKEVEGKNIKMLMPPHYSREHDNYLSNYRAGGEKKIIGIGRELEGKRKDGTVFPLYLSISEVVVRGKKIFTGVVRDITLEKQVDEEREALITQLAISNRELDDFAYIASHDLKEPLRGLHNHATFLARDYGEILDEEGKHKIDRITYLTQRLETLISDLLYFSRLGRTGLAIRETDLNDIVEDVKQMVLASMEGDIVITLMDTLPVMVCDRNQVTELFRNLIVNAIKYNESACKVIEVGIDATNSSINEKIMYVKDNGIGIDPQFHESIFRIFKRLHKQEAYGGGSGSGLTFVKKIVERHGGRIWIASGQGKGTVFYFTLGAIT